jgi:hypothetical protein
MTDSAGAILGKILERESRSFLQYLGDSFPWPNANERHREIQLEAMVAEERDLIADLGRFMVRNRIALPHLPSYPSAFTVSNFVSLYSLTPRLAADHKAAIAALADQHHSLAHTEAGPIVERLLEAKRRHLHTLETFSTEPPVAVVS